MLTHEQKCLKKISEWTWNRRRVAMIAGMPFGEESVTETVLLDLKINYPGTVKIVPFNKRQEGKNGADWEWCFVNKDETQFFPMLVQAKILDDKEKEYSHISRTIGNTGIRQIDRLIETSEIRGVPAVYAFYNYLSDVSRIPRTCRSLGRNQSQSEPWGISLARANEVLNLLPSKNFDSIAKISLPLHCLLCNKGQSNFPRGGSVEAIASSFRNLVDLPIIDYWEPKSESPSYFRLIQEMPNDEFLLIPTARAELESRKNFLIKKLEADNPEIGGIVILQDNNTPK